MSIDTTHRSPLFNYLFVNRTLAIVLALLLAGVGMIAYQAMIKESLPDLDIPQALVVTVWVGASPEMVEKEVTVPLEQRLKALKGLKRYRSGSMDSLSIVAVEFRAEADSAEAMQQLRQAVSTAEAEFPKKVQKPRIEKISVKDIPIATYTLYGDLAAAELGLAAKRLSRKLDRLAGIKKVEIMGARQEIVQVRLIPERLQSFGGTNATVDGRSAAFCGLD